MAKFACTHCSLLTDKQQCPECKNPTSSNWWSGLLIVTDPEESDVARELGITKAGEYALRVR